MQKNRTVYVTQSDMSFLTDGGGGCFPAIATVQLENGNLVTMSELPIGDRVKTGKPSVTGEISLK